MPQWTVSELTWTIADLLEAEVGHVQVVGEISGYRPASSGHRYFQLKDASAQISCVLWRDRKLNFPLEDGMQVVVEGALKVYAPRGQYQLDCQRLTPRGQGDLYLAFEILKEKLAAAGLFAQERKRPLPRMPLQIGVVTSAGGAVIQDILSTLKRRLPACQVLFCPAAVQGDAAPDEIAQAIATLNDQGQAEVLIVGRGGGSLEDLWAFNTEMVVQAIVASRLPVIAAVGHETDVTLADFAADVRAATPTAAAELVTPQTQADLLDDLTQKTQRLGWHTQSLLRAHGQQVERLATSPGLRWFPDRLRQRSQQVDDWAVTVERGLLRALATAGREVSQRGDHLRALHPLRPLDQGFALLRRDGQRLTPAEALSPGQVIEIQRRNETTLATVQSTTLLP